MTCDRAVFLFWYSSFLHHHDTAKILLKVVLITINPNPILICLPLIAFRQLDMKHPLIKQIHKDKETVLCVVKGVITTSDKAEIKRTNNKDGNIKVVEKVNRFIFQM